MCVCDASAHVGKSMLSAELEGQALLPFPGIVVRVTVGLAGQSGPILISSAPALFPFLDVALCSSSTATLCWPEEEGRGGRSNEAGTGSLRRDPEFAGCV